MLLLIVVVIIIIGSLYFLGVFDEYLHDEHNSENIYNYIKKAATEKAADLADGNVRNSTIEQVPTITISGTTTTATTPATTAATTPAVVITPESSNNTNNSIKTVEDIRKVESAPAPQLALAPQVLPALATPALAMPQVSPALAMPAIMPQVLPAAVLYTSPTIYPADPINQAKYPYGSPIADATVRLTHSNIYDATNIYAASQALLQAKPKPLPAFKFKNKTKNNICMNRMSDDYLQKQLCDGGPDQMWSFTPDKTLISSTNSNMCLSSGKILPNGENRIYATYCKSNDPNQQWQYKDVEKLLLNIGTGKCLDDGGGYSAGETYFKVHPCNDANFNQQYYEN
jgi:hypothetical protein